MIKINLLPKEIQDKGKGIEWVVLGAGLIVLFAMGAGVQYILKLNDYKKYLKTEDIWRQQLKIKEEEVQRVTQLDGERSVLEAKKSSVLQLHQGRILYPRMMDTFFNTLPQDVWVTALTFRLEGDNIAISAQSKSLAIEGIAEWLQTLESNAENFSGVTLSAIDANDSTFQFSMSFTYMPSPLKKT